ncbi:MAG: hypothetical protein HYU37_05905 [Acidobacteria bacterium]|nr:hypothetical protein [Acidobacteriota bacterium]
MDTFRRRRPSTRSGRPEPVDGRSHGYALLGYAAAAVVFTWPLTLHLGTHLTGSPAGDTGVYVWNQWVFQHELLDHGGSPYFTDKIFSLSGRANLSLHNYTAFQDLVALPLVGWLGVVPTFNLVYLLMTVLTAYATFLLARHVTGAGVESWLAGLLFAWSPILVTRGGGHFSLVAAAPLAVFLLLLLRTAERQRLGDAVALGATCCWAATADAYYAVYCLMLAGIFLITRVLHVRRRPADAPLRAARWTLDVLLFCAAGLVLTMVVSGGWQFTLLGRVTSVRSLYTPMLLLTLLAAARVALAYRPDLTPLDARAALRVLRLGTVTAVVTAALLSPALYAVGVRIVEGRWDRESVFWRSSPRGVDLLSFFVPNPNHPLAPDALGAWLSSPRPDAYYENVASLTFVALGAIALAWRTGWRIPRFWAGLTLFFGALALGPFVHAAGVNTHVPGPWAFLRYLPMVGLARTPARFSIVVMLALAVLCAGALTWLARRRPEHRRAVLALAAALLVFELWPAPRPLYSAAIPPIYAHVAAAPDDVRLLELPSGVRDGTSSVGNFTARSQFFQTMHGKRLIGGYLSRVSKRRLTDVRRDPMVDALIWLSEHKPLDHSRRRSLVEDGPAFVRRAHLGFVVVDRARAPDALRAFAIDAFRLERIDASGEFELYRPSAR